MMSIKHYTDPELLEINTLENAIYMAMQNDVSFMIGLRLSLYEHQSTFNPNLPLRYLFYISDLYSGMIDKNKLYGSRKILIPPPEFVIFYNGIQDQPDRRILRLSDLYSIRDQHCKLSFVYSILYKPCIFKAYRLLNVQTLCIFPCFCPYEPKQGKFFILRRLPYPAVLRKYASLPL